MPYGSLEARGVKEAAPPLLIACSEASAASEGTSRPDLSAARMAATGVHSSQENGEHGGPPENKVLNEIQ